MLAVIAIAEPPPAPPPPPANPSSSLSSTFAAALLPMLLMAQFSAHLRKHKVSGRFQGGARRDTTWRT